MGDFQEPYGAGSVTVLFSVLQGLFLNESLAVPLPRSVPVFALVDIEENPFGFIKPLGS